MKSNYRHDVDGLRAVAVGSVVLYHAGFPFIGGGFVGVDVFFVISGFIITRLLIREMETGTFSLLRFYERRVRRILPALFLMLTATLTVAAFIMTPVGFKDLGQSVAAVVFFASNMYFWLKTGYFEVASELKPLLHTWSLGVEEQFYLVWPLLLPFLLKLGAAWRGWLIGGLFLVSLILSQYLVATSSDSAFYLIVSRAWELMAGAMLAFGFVPRPGPRSALAAALVGSALLVGAFLTYSSQMPFPGLSALLPVAGSVLLIWSGTVSTPVSRLLSTPAMVSVGALSYSIYIWHWPIFSLSWYVLARQFTAIEAVAAIATTLVIALLSYRYVETPVRRAPARLTRAIVSGVAVCAVAIAGVGVGSHFGSGFPARLPEQAVAMAGAGLDINPRRGQCAQTTPADIARGQLCDIGNGTAAAVDFALLGDSFADAIMPGMDSMAVTAGQRGVALVQSGCLPLPGVDQIVSTCRERADAAFAYLQDHPEIETVYLVARWTAGVTGSRFGEFTHSGYWLRDAQTRQPGPEENAAVLERSLRRLADGLPNRKVVLVAGVPEQLVDVPRYLAVRATFPTAIDKGVPRAVYEERRAKMDVISQRLLDGYANWHVLDLGPSLCNTTECPMMLQDTVLYADDNHLTRSAAILLSPLFATYL